MKHFASILDTPANELRHALDLAHALKQQRAETGLNEPILEGKTLAMVFEKPSLRTRVSFLVAMRHLGGLGLVLSRDEVGLGTREPVEDVARVLGGMCDGIMARVFEHEKILELMKYSPVPVINGLSDFSHPCQAMADVMTIEEEFKTLKGKTLAYIGDGNNVARSLAEACAKFEMKFAIATPKGYELPHEDFERITGKVKEFSARVTHDPAKAVRRADVLYTDTWVSMGQEDDRKRRVEAFKGFAIDESLIKRAPKCAIILHCLPAYRGYEISAGAMEHPRSRVFEQGANRLHAQKGLLAILMGGM